MSDTKRNLLTDRIRDGRAILEIVEGPDAGIRCVIEVGATIRIGREPGCDLSLTDPNVEPTHASIRSNGKEVTLFGESSSGPILFEGQPIHHRILHPGDRFLLGSTTLAIHHHDHPSPAPIAEGQVDREAMRLGRRLIKAGQAQPQEIEAALQEWRETGPTRAFGEWLIEQDRFPAEELAPHIQLRKAHSTIVQSLGEPPPGSLDQLVVADHFALHLAGALIAPQIERGEPVHLQDLADLKEHLPFRSYDEVRSIQATLERIGPVPGFRAIQLLGAGSTGFVLEALKGESGAKVAIKLIRPELLDRSDALSRFRRESKMLLQFDHPNLVRGLEVGETGGTQFIVMEHVSGTSLAQEIEDSGPFPEEQGLDILRQVSRGLSEIERLGILHRDIKPANILLTPDGPARLCDMGLSKSVEANTHITASGFVVGTPNYMSPEQAQGIRDLDIRCDIYSLGVTFFEAFTGEIPFSHVSPIEVMLMHIGTPVPDPRKIRPELSKGLSTVLVKMLAKRPEHRFDGCASLLQAIGA